MDGGRGRLVLPRPHRRRAIRSASLPRGRRSILRRPADAAAHRRSSRIRRRAERTLRRRDRSSARLRDPRLSLFRFDGSWVLAAIARLRRTGGFVLGNLPARHCAATGSDDARHHRAAGVLDEDVLESRVLDVPRPRDADARDRRAASHLLPGHAGASRWAQQPGGRVRTGRRGRAAQSARVGTFVPPGDARRRSAVERRRSTGGRPDLLRATVSHRRALVGGCRRLASRLVPVRHMRCRARTSRYSGPRMSAPSPSPRSMAPMRGAGPPAGGTAPPARTAPPSGGQSHAVPRGGQSRR